MQYVCTVIKEIQVSSVFDNVFNAGILRKYSEEMCRFLDINDTLCFHEKIGYMLRIADVKLYIKLIFGLIVRRFSRGG